MTTQQIEPFRIVCDTREQHPLLFRKSRVITGTIIKKLNVGDYSIEGYENKISIERKSAQDLFQSLGRGHKRFGKEIEKAKGLDYFAVVVEEPFRTIYEKAFESAHFTGLRGDVVAKICCTLEIRGDAKFFFCQDRAEAVSLIRHLFKAYLRNLKAKAKEKT